ncbi:unnamed protein product [Penicillium discolor]
MSSSPHTPSDRPSEPRFVTPVNAEARANAPGPIAIDNFSDESVEFSDDLSDLTSLSESVLEFEYENGRRYCSARSGHYMYFHIFTYKLLGRLN